jgi:outer membrane protein insertion porin family
MRPAGRIAGELALLLMGFSQAAPAAVGDYLGKPVAAVRLVIEGRDTTEPALAQMVATQVGRPLSMADVRESLTHLFSLGRFEDVRVDAALADNAVTLRYELSPIHPVSKIEFAGTLHAPGVDQGQLRRAVVDRFGVSPPLGRAAELAGIVAETLRERGYLHAVVTPRADIAHRPERATLVFTVEPQSRTRVGTIDIDGTPAAPRTRLLDQLRLATGAPYERVALNARIDRYLEGRRAQGYYEAKLVPTVRLADDDRVANITLAVDSGPLVHVAFAGDPLPSDRRAELVPVEREGSADEDVLEDSSNRIEEFLRAQGYRDAAAPHTREQSSSDLLITFTVSKGPLYRVSRVEISGNPSLPLSEFEPSLRLRDAQPFSAAKLDADVSTIQDLYHRLGFSAAKVQAGLELELGGTRATQVPVLVRIVINEGVRTTIGSVRFAGNQSTSETTLSEGLNLQPGRPFVPALLGIDRDQIQRQLANRGYQNATVDAQPQFSQDGTRADILFTVHEGPQIFVDHVLIVGNVRTSTGTIERELQLKPGDPVGLDAVNESQRRLSALGLFRRARITELAHGDETRRDLLVTIEEAPATTVGYGGGVEGRLRVVRRAEDGGVAAQRLEFAPRAFFEIGRRNLFGKNRSINVFSSISLHPKDSPFFAEQANPSSDTGYGLTEYRVQGTFREPRVFNTAFDAFVTATVEQQIRSSFNFARRSASAEVARRLTRAVSVSGSYQIQRTDVFDENVSESDQLLIDRTFTQVLLSSFSTSLIRDTRDDAVEPGAGKYLSVNGQLAARRIGSEVGFAKSFFTAQAFRTVPHTNRIVLAGNARLGLATGFPQETRDGLPLIDEEGQPVRDLPQSERFYAGGDTTVRGFALDTLGTRHVPALQSDTIDKDGFPRGGNGLVIFNGELRVPVRRILTVVGFVDTGNVFKRAADLDLLELRTAVGGGVRYKSPVGPIRVDLGFKVHRQANEGLTAWFITFGQAF